VSGHSGTERSFLLWNCFSNRRNWLFSDTVAGANAAANLYSFVRTRKANSIDPYQYLIALFKGLPHAHTAGDYVALLPWRLNPHAA
jgi:transposase